MPGKVYVPIASFVTEIDGQTVWFRADKTRVREGHPLLRRRQHLFRELENEIDYEWEDATADPGILRGEARRRAPKK